MGCNASSMGKTIGGVAIDILSPTAKKQGKSDNYDELIKSTLRQSVSFLQFDKRDLEDTMKRMEILTFRDKEMIYFAKKPSDALYVILHGPCFLMDVPTSVGKFDKGSIAGEKDMFGQSNYSHSLIAGSSRCKVAKLLKSDFEAVAAECARKHQSPCSRGICNTVLFQAFPGIVMRHLENCAITTTYEKGEMIIIQDSLITAIHIIQHGLAAETLEIDGDKFTIALLDEFDYFGEECIVGGTSLTNAMAVKKTVVITIAFKDLKKILGPGIGVVCQIAAARKIDQIEHAHTHHLSKANLYRQPVDVDMEQMISKPESVNRDQPTHELLTTVTAMATPMTISSVVPTVGSFAYMGSNSLDEMMMKDAQASPDTYGSSPDFNILQRVMSLFIDPIGVLMCFEAKVEVEPVYDLHASYPDLPTNMNMSMMSSP